jgi:hypothetical protein
MALLRPRRRRPLLVGLLLACGVFLRLRLHGPDVTRVAMPYGN